MAAAAIESGCVNCRRRRDGMEKRQAIGFARKFLPNTFIGVWLCVAVCVFREREISNASTRNQTKPETPEAKRNGYMIGNLRSTRKTCHEISSWIFRCKMESRLWQNAECNERKIENDDKNQFHNFTPFAWRRRERRRRRWSSLVYHMSTN